MSAAVAVDVAFVALLLTSWLIERPHDDYSSVDGMFLSAMFSVLLVGWGWYVTGGWRPVLFGCGFQFARLIALAGLFFISFSAFNPHMDNPCNDAISAACEEHARNAFFSVYSLLVLTSLASGAGLALVLWRERTASTRTWSADPNG
jgi:hypothetical protein